MNLVGKIFTVLILVMSLVFMSFAVAVYATHKNWREIVMLSRQDASAANKQVGLKLQLEDARAVAKELRDRLDKNQQELEQEKLAHRTAVAKLKTENGDLARKNSTLEQSNKDLTEEKNKATESLGTTEARNKTLLEETLALRQRIRDAEKERDEKADLLVQKTDLLLQAQSEVNRLKEKLAAVAKQLIEAKEVLVRYDLNPDPKFHLGATVKGLVTAVRGEGLVEISIGSDDGLKKGARLRVIRADGSMYLGQVEVLELQTDRGVCRIVQNTQQGAINKGDRVISDLTDVQFNVTSK